jgi:hypothetical protein
MAAVTVAFIGTKAVQAESTTGWNAGNLDTDIFVEGNSSVGAKTSNTTADFYDLSITGSPYDFSSGGADEGKHIFAWFNTLTPVSLHGIIAVDDLATDSLGYWAVGPPTGYGGGWINYVIDPANNALFTVITAGTGSWTGSGNPAQLSGVDGFGGRHTTSTSIMGNFNNALVDAVSVGTGYRIYGGDGVDPDAVFADLISYEQITANRFGGLRAPGGGVLLMMSKILLGNGAAATDFTDSGFTVVWLDAPVATTFYEFAVDPGASGTINLSLSNGLLADEAGGFLTCDFRNLTQCILNTVNIDGAKAVYLQTDMTITNGVWTGLAEPVYVASEQPSIDGLALVNPVGIGMQIQSAGAMTNISGLRVNGAGTYSLEVDIAGAGPFDIYLDSFISQTPGTNHIVIRANNNADYTFYLTGSGTGLSVGDITNEGTGTVTVVASRTLSLINLPEGSEVTFVRDADLVELHHIESVDVTGIASYTYSAGDAGTVIYINVLPPVDAQENDYIEVTLAATDQTLIWSGLTERVYSNP